MCQLQILPPIFEKVLLQARESNKSVRRVQLVLGEIAEIDPETIQKRWEELSKGTLVERADLQFRFTKAEVQCMACFQKYHPQNGEIHCPYCGSFGAKILAGEEFYLEAVELDHEQT